MGGAQVAVRVVVQMHAKPGQGDQMLELVRNDLMPDTAAAEGALEFELLRDLDDRDKLVMVARWRDRSDHVAYMDWRASTGIGHDDLAELMAGYSVTYCETVGTW
jgi:quinol monooxygenase YgiN